MENTKAGEAIRNSPPDSLLVVEEGNAMDTSNLVGPDLNEKGDKVDKDEKEQEQDGLIRTESIRSIRSNRSTRSTSNNTATAAPDDAMNTSIHSKTSLDEHNNNNDDDNNNDDNSNNDDDIDMDALEQGTASIVKNTSHDSTLHSLEETTGVFDDEIYGESTVVEIPAAGLSVEQSKRSQWRSVSNLCAICLCNYQVGDDIVWASNPACDHAFHKDCIERWLIKQRGNPLCPCCRRDFVIDPLDAEDDVDMGGLLDFTGLSSNPTVSGGGGGGTAAAGTAAAGTATAPSPNTMSTTVW